MQTHSLADPLLEAGLPDGVRALVVADDPLLRERFVARLGAMAAGHAAAADDLFVAVQRSQANLVVWDLGPGGGADLMDGTFGGLGVPVVALSSQTGSARPLLSAGATAVLRRDGSAEALRSALAPVLHGLVVVDPALDTIADDGFATGRALSSPTAGTDVEPLTARETEVVELIATGLSNKLIAERLGISAHTVKFHVNAILAKLDVHSRTEAVVRAVQLGVVML
jgi:two-component system, NarL family, nitrate/nitrite response regulator NarL